MPLRSVRRETWAERRRALMGELDEPKKAVPVVEKPAKKAARKKAKK